MDKTIMPLPLSSSRFSRLSPSPPPSSFLPRAAPQARLRRHRDGLPGRRPWTWARPRRPQDRLPREEAVAASSPVPASDGLPGRWPWPRRPQDRLPRACAALRPRLRSWSLAPPAPALASAARDAEWFNPAAHSWRRLERVRAPPSAAHVVFRGRVWCIEGNAMMEWMGTRRGWREVGPYPPGLKAGTTCAVYVGGGEKVVVTGTLDGKGGGGRHALWVFDVKTKQWTVVGPLPEFAGFVFSVTSSPRVAGPVIHACVLVPAAPSACSSSVLDPRALVEVPQTPVPAVRFGRIWRDSGCCRDEMWARSVIGGGASLVLKSNGSDPIECGTI